MKHCQITGVEMPDEIEYPPMWAIMSESDKASFLRIRREVHVAYRDAQTSDQTQNLGREIEASAEFPEALKIAFMTDFDNVESAERKLISRGARWGFEKGRASVEDLWFDRVEQLMDERVNLKAKLADAQAEIESLEAKLIVKHYKELQTHEIKLPTKQ